MDNKHKGKANKGQLAIALGVVACAAACALPFLGVAGLGAALTGWLSSSLEVAGAVLIAGGAAALGIGLLRRKRGRADTQQAPGCGCKPAAEAEADTAKSVRDAIACTLSDARTGDRVTKLREIFDTAYLRSERLPGGLRWRFTNSPERAARIRALADEERDCCTSFRFDIHTQGEEVWWDTYAQPEARSLLEQWAGLPQLLSSQAQAFLPATTRLA